MLRKRVEAAGDPPEILAARLENMKEKCRQIENSLSSETKVKMDLFSALGEAKREIAIKTCKYICSCLAYLAISYLRHFAPPP